MLKADAETAAAWLPGRHQRAISDVGSFLLFGLERDGYRLALDPASELGRANAPDAPWFNLGFFILPGLAILWFAASLDLRLGNHWPAPVVAILLGVSGLSLAASGAVPMQAGAPALSLPHRLVGVPLLTALPIGILFLPLALPAGRPWSGCRHWSIVVGSLLVMLDAAYQVASATIPVGVFQRLSLLVLTGWLTATGLTLFKGWSAAGVAADLPGLSS
jgi:uncharacterized protein DUF998